MSLPTLTFRTVTYCTDPRCTTTGKCQRAEHERYGNAPGENYGPRCVPAPPLASGAAAVYAMGVEEGERRAIAAVVAWLRDTEEAWHMKTWQVADAIERGEHRREEE